MQLLSPRGSHAVASVSRQPSTKPGELQLQFAMNTSSKNAPWRSLWIRSLQIALAVGAPGSLGAQVASDAVRAEAAAEAQETAWLAQVDEWTPDGLDGLIPPDVEGRFKAEPIGMLGRLRLFRVDTRMPDGQWPPYLVAFEGEELLRLGGFPSPDLIVAWRAILAPGRNSLAGLSDSLLLASGRSLAWVASPELSVGVATGDHALPAVTPYRLTVGGSTCRPGGPKRDQADSIIRRNGSIIVRLTLPVQLGGFANPMITRTWWFVIDGRGELSGWVNYDAPLCQGTPP